MSLPRDHHFIPAFYLKQWCNPATGKLVEYTIKNEKLISKRVGPHATGHEFDLYAFPELPREYSHYIEQKFFDYADRAAAEALQLHLSGYASPWTSEQRSAWTRFVMALHLRHPDAMPELRDAAKGIWEGSGETTQHEYERIRQSGDPETFDEYIAKMDPDFPAKARMELILSVFDNPMVGEHINRMAWAVVNLDAPERLLLTSDRPVTFFTLKDPNGALYVPISPTKLFIAANDSKLFDEIRRTKLKHHAIAGRINKEVVARARRFVWVSDQRQEAFIRKHMSTRLEPKPFYPNVAGSYSDPAEH